MSNTFRVFSPRYKTITSTTQCMSCQTCRGLGQSLIRIIWYRFRAWNQSPGPLRWLWGFLKVATGTQKKHSLLEIALLDNNTSSGNAFDTSCVRCSFACNVDLPSCTQKHTNTMCLTLHVDASFVLLCQKLS